MCAVLREPTIQQKKNSSTIAKGASNYGCRNSSADGKFDRSNTIGILIESNLQKGKVMFKSILTSLII